MMAAATAETEYVMPEKTQTAIPTPTPTPTPINALAGKVAAAVDAQKNGATPPPATPNGATPAAPPAPAPAATTPVDKNAPRHKLIQVLLEDQPLFRDALVKAANDAQLSPASWAKMVLAEKLGVTLPPPEKRASDPVAKATLAADKKLLELVLIRDHYKRIAATEPIIAPMAAKADAAIASYVKKLAGTVGQEKADAILKATEEKIAATRK